MEFAVNLCEGDQIQSEHIPAYVKTPVVDTVEVQPSISIEKQEFVIDASSDSRNLDWPDVERQMIMDALVKARGNRAKAAKLLGLGRSTLWRKMKIYSMVP